MMKKQFMSMNISIVYVNIINFPFTGSLTGATSQTIYVVFTDIKGWEVDTFTDLQELYDVAEELAFDVSTIIGMSRRQLQNCTKYSNNFKIL